MGTNPFDGSNTVAGPSRSKNSAEKRPKNRDRNQDRKSSQPAAQETPPLSQWRLLARLRGHICMSEAKLRMLSRTRERTIRLRSIVKQIRVARIEAIATGSQARLPRPHGVGAPNLR
jgi:hypothetical protein